MDYLDGWRYFEVNEHRCTYSNLKICSLILFPEDSLRLKNKFEVRMQETPTEPSKYLSRNNLHLWTLDTLAETC